MNVENLIGRNLARRIVHRYGLRAGRNARATHCRATHARTQIARATLALVLASFLFADSGQPVVHVAPMDSVGPRSIEPQTQSSIIRDYLAAWKSLDRSMNGNRPDLLDAYFVGQAKQELARTIEQQKSAGIHTGYQDTSHNIRVVFYSPEGLSIQLIDDAEYDVHVRAGDGSVGSKHVQTRYVAVLTPTESRWKVRIFQGGAS